MTAVAIALKLRFSVKHGLLSRCGLCVKSLGRLCMFNHDRATCLARQTCNGLLIRADGLKTAYDVDMMSMQLVDDFTRLIRIDRVTNHSPPTSPDRLAHRGHHPVMVRTQT